MKATGITRKIDELGRIVLPKELRDMFGWKEKDALEILVDDNNTVVLRKYESQLTCQITGEVSFRNQSFADGKITLSEEGIKQLLKEINNR